MIIMQLKKFSACIFTFFIRFWWLLGRIYCNMCVFWSHSWQKNMLNIKYLQKKISSCVGQKHLNSSGSMIYMQDRHLNACLDFCGNLADFCFDKWSLLIFYWHPWFEKNRKTKVLRFFIFGEVGWELLSSITKVLRSKSFWEV